MAAPDASLDNSELYLEPLTGICTSWPEHVRAWSGLFSARLIVQSLHSARATDAWVRCSPGSQPLSAAQRLPSADGVAMEPVQSQHAARHHLPAGVHGVDGGGHAGRCGQPDRERLLSSPNRQHDHGAGHRRRGRVSGRGGVRRVPAARRRFGLRDAVANTVNGWTACGLIEQGNEYSNNSTPSQEFSEKQRGWNTETWWSHKLRLVSPCGVPARSIHSGFSTVLDSSQFVFGTGFIYA